ncbi:MAG: GNAT family N-acetyltransferase [Clostridiales bacterium]|nr:GNAT family N-acetyltransferase [Clostridiales bacterium]
MENKLVLKLFTMEQVELLYKWANDPDCRKNSFQTESIPYETHVKWCSDKLESNDVDIYIAYLNSIPVGQLRVMYKERTALISYSIDKNFRGLGLGLQLIQSIEKYRLYGENNINELVGKVKLDNIASQKVFEKCYYEKIVENDHFVYRKYIKSEL